MAQQLKTSFEELEARNQELQRLDKLRQATEQKYRSIVENAVEGIFQSTLDGRYVIVNPMLAKIYGYHSPTELIHSLTDIQHQLYVDPGRREAFVEEIMQSGAVIGFESDVYRKDGSIIWISESARAIYNEHNQVIGFEGTVEDITDRKRDQLELQRRDHLLQAVADASHTLLTSPELNVALPQILRILGIATNADRVYIYENHPHPQTQAPAMSMRYEWTQPDITASITQPHWQNQSYAEHGLMLWYEAFQACQPIRGLVENFPTSERLLLQKDAIQSILMVPILINHVLWGYIGFDACRTARQWTPGEESILVTIAASLGGVLRRHRTEEQIRYQAFHDSLTGLPNRTAFSQYLSLCINQAKANHSLIAVMFLDLDRFKNINDTLGHAIGDELLVQVTQRLGEELRKGDMLARWGGDEFVLILQNLTSIKEAEALSRRLGSILKPPFLIDDQELYITSSIGIAMYPLDGNNVTTLLQNADAAMYSAKAEGRNTYRFYTATLNADASHQLTLEKHLHQALQQEEFKLFFQPQIDIQQQKICKVEALIRWHSPVLGWVTPMHFIPVAEEIGLIMEIGDWVLQEACQQLQNWHKQGFDSLKLAVNLSARQLQQPLLVVNIQNLLSSLGLSPPNLEVEITETAALSNLEASIATLNQLRQLGTRVMMDDFGTGYSSLSYLKRLPFHGLKIDQSFVRGIPTDAQDVAMLRAIIALGEELGLTLVAEGVETYEQLMCLKELGCSTMQGYWFSRSVDCNAMTTFLHKHWQSYNADHLGI
jgi:diguanylate cyclase (GGDEF)-like protein/PAS domain S-box-containing protein